MKGLGPESAWVTRFAPMIRPGGRVLDLACGGGRHLRWLHARGFRVTGVDRDRAALALLAGLGTLIEADLEGGPWPLEGQRFDGIVVTNYLWRPLFKRLRESLAPQGVLIYETFADGHQKFGRPARPEFLLRHGELLAAWPDLQVVAYEDGWLDDPARCVQRIAAVDAAAADPTRHRLAGPGGLAGTGR